MKTCEFCSRDFGTVQAWGSHVRQCKQNPDRIIRNRSGVNNPMYGKKGGNQFTKAVDLGLEPPKVTKETSRAISEKLKGKVWSQERRESFSERMREIVKENPDSYSSHNVCGRSKRFLVDGVLFHSSWEVVFADYLNKRSLAWTREIEAIPYIWKGKQHLYFPDFYIPEIDMYVEVKGYETERDHAKWSCIDNLIIIRESEINKIISGEIISGL